MKNVRELHSAQLQALVANLQALLYLDQESDGREVWNPDKAWSPDTLARVAEKLAEYGLVPKERTAALRYRTPDEVNGLLARLEGRLTEGLLDDLVIDLKCGEASDLNNAGIEDQIAYLIEQLGAAEATRQITDLLNDVAGDEA